MRLIWDEAAWEQYLYWQQTDRALLRKINMLLKECQRTPFVGTGKPEALKGDSRGYWSRRINHEHRLVYKATDDGLNTATTSPQPPQHPPLEGVERLVIQIHQ